ncbi:bifunctional RNase H/acid phosphatase [Streptomyces tsukubensis]|uniref:Bifunctional RNase H/acid phosphatase n=1 Tax=Streptomyces tsukubensis TaxID=83656 RepID=A0A1V4A6D0_9ACTN|nr:bifunctional RNase H/acid phosphatase [Streptomyces tsukubensis]OON76720.1 bifunctional RNase H/acid phosphatase [Streptomyces tsukubensis]QFR93313.1 bifunctional RNase H/acid phosphatase [Streptomyces tsukubensis]
MTTAPDPAAPHPPARPGAGAPEPGAVRALVVEADGGSRGNPGPAGYGAVVIDQETGETLAEAAEFIGVATNNVAEYRGLIAGLEAARALAGAGGGHGAPVATGTPGTRGGRESPGAPGAPGISGSPDVPVPAVPVQVRVHVRMDSKLVVEQMSGRWRINHPGMRALAAEAARIFPPGQITYEWIPRAENKHADRLANEAMDAGARGERWSAERSTAELDAGAARSAAGAGAAATAARSTDSVGGSGSAGGSEKARAAGAVAGASAAPGASGAKRASAPAAGWSGPDLGAPATLLLLRHGETALTPEKRFSGSGGSDPELSATGREQAEGAAKAFAARGTVDAVVTSPLLRCRQTAGAVADALGLDVSVEDGVRETDFGAWEGLSFAEVRERFPDDLTAWLASTEAEPTGGGESFAAVTSRVMKARDRLIERYAGRTVLVVSHVTPIKTLVRLALGAPPEAVFRMELSAAALSTVAHYRDGNASVRLFNDTSHLR